MILVIYVLYHIENQFILLRIILHSIIIPVGPKKKFRLRLTRLQHNRLPGLRDISHPRKLQFFLFVSSIFLFLLIYAIIMSIYTVYLFFKEITICFF